MGSDYIMGRLEKIAPREQRRGHAVRARVGERLLDSTRSDGSGRFLLEWGTQAEWEKLLIELLDSTGGVEESMELEESDLVSPPVVVFTGERVVGHDSRRTRPSSAGNLQADGDSPVCVLSSCQEASLTWTAPAGSDVKILSGGEMVAEGLPPQGVLKVVEEVTKQYSLRVSEPGGARRGHSESTVEVRRYRSMSLVVDGVVLRTGSPVDIGASLSCPAKRDGTKVAVKSSDPEAVPDFEIAIPPGLRWGSTRVTLGGKKGLVKITAFSKGYVRDIVDLYIE